MFYFFTKTNPWLFFSLQRFFKYVLNQELKEFTSNAEFLDDDILIIYYDDRENQELQNFFLNNKIPRKYLVGYDQNGLIDLLFTDKLKTELAAIQSNTTSFQLFTDDEIKEKLKQLFHSHGQESLFEKLSKCQYYLVNGINLFLINELDRDTVNESFLKPGIENWVKYKERFYNYEYYIKIYSKKADWEKLTKLNLLVDDIIIEVKRFTNFDEVLVSEEKVVTFVVCFNQLNEILLNFSIGLTNSDEVK